ncbi:MAG TPA: hypothetical protein VN719_09460 [Gemmatimonadales bacterium]|nr:hypothetical protein [Gemmatimonadales bacterium]
MELNPEQRAQAQRFFEDKWRMAGVCPICGTTGWEMSSSIVQLMGYYGGTLVAGGPVFPLVPVFCKNCGYTLLFSAIAMGIVIPEPPAPNVGTEAAHG